MFKKVIVGLLVCGVSSLFAMSLSELNSANKADLMKISGIAKAKATAILKERKNGKFKSFDDLTRVKGIGKKISNNVQNYVLDTKVQETTVAKEINTKEKNTTKKN